MARQRKAPALGDAEALEKKGNDHRLPFPHTLAGFRAQAIASRYALPLEQAAMIAPLALGSANG